jgi:hypothetical protein
VRAFGGSPKYENLRPIEKKHKLELKMVAEGSRNEQIMGSKTPNGGQGSGIKLSKTPEIGREH